ncbi:MAG TPA: LPXTG cell wall anchor domain-containing protein [Gaiellaceae bacterium]|nr:LPXTG cell wall anchor domain-containing protein [Gaiellaceae bacterium]
MGIVNRRNAVIGWLVVKAGKRAAKRKAQGAVPDKRAAGGVAAGALAAVGGVLLFWKKKKSGGTDA